MTREGSAHPASPTILAGTPATVFLSGTGYNTTEPAAMREQWPISILPRILAPAPISTPDLIFGWRSPRSLPRDEYRSGTPRTSGSGDRARNLAGRRSTAHAPADASRSHETP